MTSKKYSYSCSSCTNVNNLSGKHIIEYSTPNSDRLYQFTFLMIKGTIQIAIQNKTLHLRSSTKYCTNANNPLKKWLLLKNHAWLSSIHKPASLDIKFFWYFYHVIWVENHKNWVYLFTGHPVYKNEGQVCRMVNCENRKKGQWKE